jgi:tetratricopeptide (TPR) repeat protein
MANNFIDGQSGYTLSDEKVIFNPRDELAYQERGDAQIRLGNPKEALSNYRRAIQINPKFIKAYYGMATAHAILGLYSHAMAEIVKAMELEKQQGINNVK